MFRRITRNSKYFGKYILGESNGNFNKKQQEKGISNKSSYCDLCINRMRLTCDETVTFETIRESVNVLIKYLIEAGWISKVNENEYVNHLTEKESTI